MDLVSRVDLLLGPGFWEFLERKTLSLDFGANIMKDFVFARVTLIIMICNIIFFHYNENIKKNNLKN